MKRIATILLITVLISQTAAAAKKTSGDLLSFEYGVLTVYNLDAASPLGAGYLFGLGIVLTDSLEASFVHTKGDGTILKKLQPASPQSLHKTESRTESHNGVCGDADNRARIIHGYFQKEKIQHSNSFSTQT